MVTNLRHGTTKNGNAYGIFTLEDYAGGYEFALFGKNYIEFNKYMIKDLYLYIHALVQEKGADFKFKKPEKEVDGTKELELKIQKIEVFSDIKDKLVDKITISLNPDKITYDWAQDLISFVSNNKGNINLYIQLVEEFNQSNRVKLFSRQHRFQMTKNFYQFLKYNKENKTIIDFKVN
jgi:DNA polymerase-3 subunit alpha